MKRTIIALMIIFLCGTVFAQKPEALIREITGTVELKKAGAASWAPARIGDRIEEATMVSTGFKSMAILSVGNSTLTVRALTRLSLEALVNQNETESINLNLSTGRVRADVKPPAGGRASMTIQTPVATASVRGTVFDVDPTDIRVIEGAVRYEPKGKAAPHPVTVHAGQQSWVATDSGKAVSPAAAAEASRELPSLPGRSAAPKSEGGARLETPTGSLVLGIDVDSIH